MASPVVVPISADTSAFQSSMAGLADSVLQSIAGLNPIVAGVVGVIAGIGVAAVDAASKLEEANNSIAIATGAQGDALAGLQSDFEAVYANVPNDASEVATAIGDINTRLGLTGTALQDSTTQFVNFATVLGEDVHGVITSLTQTYNDWGVASDDIAGKNDYLFKVTQQTGIGASELGDSLSKFGPTLRGLGVDFDHAAALIGNLQKAGGLGSDAMTGLQRAVANLTQAGVPANQALEQIVSSIQNAESPTEAASTAIEVFGTRAGPQLADAIKNGQFSVDGLVQSLNDSPNTINDAAESTRTFSDMLGTLFHSVDLLLEPIGTVLIDAGKAVVGVFQELTDGTGVLGGAFSGLMDWLQPISDFVTNSFLPVFQDIATLYIGLQSVIYDGLGAALGWLWNNILQPVATFIRDVVVAAFTAVSTAVGDFIGVLKELPGVSSLFEAGQQTINAALGTSKTKADEAKTATANLNTAHGALVTTLNGKVNPALGSLHGNLDTSKSKKDLATQATKDLDSAESLLAKTYKDLQEPAVKSVYEALKDVETKKNDVKTAADKLKQAEDDLKTKLDNSKTSTGDLQAAMGRLETAKGDVKTATDNLKLAEDALSASQQQAKADADALKKSYDDMVTSMGSLNSGIPDVIQNIGDSDSAIQALSQSIDDTAMNKAVALQTALSNLGVTSSADLKQAADDAETSFQTISDSGIATSKEISDAWAVMTQAQRDYAESIGDTSTVQALDRQLQAHQNTASGVVSTWQSATTQISTIMNDMGKQFTSGIMGLFDNSENDQINQNISKLEDSLAERTQKYQDHVADVKAQLAQIPEAMQADIDALNNEEAGKLQDIQIGAHVDLSDLDSSLQDALDQMQSKYDDYASGIKDKIDDVTAKNREALASRLSDLEDNIADSQKAYDRQVQDLDKNYKRNVENLKGKLDDQGRDYRHYVQDQQLKLDQLEGDESDSAKRQREQIKLSLQQRKEDYDANVADIQTQIQRAEEDYKTSLDRKTADHNAQQEAIKQKEQETTDQYNAQLAQQVGDLESSLADRKAKYDSDKAAELADYDDRKTQILTKLDTQNADIKTKYDGLRDNVVASYGEQTTGLQTELDNAKGDYDTFKTDVTTKIGNLKDDLKSPIDKIGDMLSGIFTSAGTALSRFMGEEFMGKLFGQLDTLLQKIPGINTALGGLFGGGTSAASSAANAGSSGIPGVGSTGSSAGSTASSVGSSALGWANFAAAGVSAISGIIGNFQQARQENTLNAIEESTRYSALFLGGRADQGILGILFKINEEISWGTTNKAVLALKDYFSTTGDGGTYLKNLDFNTYWSLQKLDDINNHLNYDISSKLDTIANSLSVTNNVSVYLDSTQIAATVKTSIEKDAQFAAA